MYQVVIAEDEATIRKGIVSLFPWEQFGFEVAASFPNGREVWEYIRSHPVDVIFSDIRMPIMDGLELAKKLQDRTDIRLVFFSGFQDFSYARAAIQNGVCDYIIKPIKYDELLKCLTRLKKQLDAEHHVQKTEPEEKPLSYYEAIVHEVRAYVDDNYKTATLEEAARTVGLSPNYVSKIMKEHSDCGFSEYLLKCRMENAARMLSDIHYKQYEIADRVGYDNPKNFSRAFHQHYGMSPSDYRNRRDPGDEKQ